MANATLSKTVGVQGIEVPRFLYGTAWKEARTERLVEAAIAAGFRGIDTANQRKHYDEAAVGTAIRKILARGDIARDALFLQSKYTDLEGQDHRLPYDPAANDPTQVRQSFQSSLEHLGVDRLDSYLIHGPRSRAGLSGADREVWRTMEELKQEGRVGLLGVSNVAAEQVSILCDIARFRPALVQNRCYARLGWDRDVREVCRREGVVYQGFSLLTANVAELRSAEIARIAARHGRSPTGVIFRFALHIGMICLTGTTNPEHMRDDLSAFDFELSDDEVATIEKISA